MARTEWLSEGAEKLAFLPECKDGEFHCDIAIVGSGYGGAVAAAALAGRREEDGQPSRVWVLERGNEFVTGSFPERFADLIGQARVRWGSGEPQTSGRPDGLFDMRLGGDVSALLGNGVGGGSLINAGVLARPRDSVFRAPWPRSINAAALDPHFQTVEQELGMAKLGAPLPKKVLALQALGSTLDGRNDDRLVGIAVTQRPGKNRAEIHQAACIGCGDCFTGCNHRAKNSLAMNYLPLAKSAGARILSGITVLSLAGSDQAGWKLDWRFTDRQVARRFGAVPRELVARRVILAAGAYGSTGILLRSSRVFQALSLGQLGQRFSTNGDMIAAGFRMPQEINASSGEGKRPDQRGVGPTIAAMIDLRSARVPLAIEELAIPAALRRPFEEIVTTFGMLHGLARRDGTEHRHDGAATDPAAIDARALQRTAVYATMGDDGAQGALRLAPRAVPAEEHMRLDDEVRIAWQGVGDLEVFTEAIRLLEEKHEGRGALLPNPMWRALPGAIGGILDEGQVGGSVFTVHPLGGCGMAEDARDGVVNEFGQVFCGAQGGAVHGTLAVLDGSIVPTALEINPCLTIAALADRAAAHLRQDWKLSERQEPLGQLDPEPRLDERKLEDWPASQPTAIRLAERLNGPLRLDVVASGRRYAIDFGARLEIEYQEVPDLEAFLSGAGKVMAIPRARLHLESMPAQGSGLAGLNWQGTVELEGSLRLFERETSTPRQRILRAGCAWLRNRGLREIWGWVRDWMRNKARGKGRTRSLRELFEDWKAVASNAGEARLMIYDLKVKRDVRFGHGAEAGLLLANGERLTGTKRIAYVGVPWLFRRRDRWSSPWDQLTRLPVYLHRDGSAPARVGLLEVDLPYWVQQYATQLQIASQENQPRALADLFSLFTYLVRLIGKIHIWSFRAPDYPDPYPAYEFTDPFNRETARQARADAKAAGRSLEDRLEQRLPGEVRGLERRFIDVPAQLPPQRDQQALKPQIRLTGYRRPGRAPDKGPVLLIHGLGASGNTFTLPTVREPLVKHLAERGFEPWVLDLRTSIGLASSKRDWTFDDTAFGDIPRAIDIVRGETGAPRVHVVAHCIGAAMFSMAALAGKLPAGSIGRVVLSQAGPLMELPPANRFRGYLASYLKHYLNVDEFDTAASLSRFNRFLDRVLAAYPYPAHEEMHHHPLWPCARMTHEAYCLRSYGIYGRLFEHANLNEETLERLGDYLGHVRYKTYQQTIFYATMRRLTDMAGRNLYVTPDNLENHFRFPVCFLHGTRNEVFHVRTSRRSFDLLASIFWHDDLASVWQTDLAGRNGYRAYANGDDLRIVEVQGYGHQDCMIGKDARRDVYPRISAFLLRPSVAPRAVDKVYVVRPPRMGPVIGSSGLRGGKYVTRMVLVPNDSRSRPLYAMTAVIRPDGSPVPRYGKFHLLRALGADDPPAQSVDVELPGAGDYRVMVVTVHHEQYEPEPAREVGEPPLDDPFGEDVDRFPMLDRDFPSPEKAAGLKPEEVDAFVQPVLETCKDLGLNGAPLAPGRRVSDPRYASPVSFAVLSQDVLKAGDPALDEDRICFALASCRYASTVADREQADREFGAVRDLLEGKRRGAVPQLLFLAGDAIYADATYGVFDPTLGIERYDQRYLEAWTSPNAREVMRRIPVFPMLDDHELEENYDGVRVPLRRSKNVEAGLSAFESFALRLTPAFPDPGQAWPENHRYDYRTTAGGFGFFVLDTRTRRWRERGVLALRATIGEDQLDALEAWLLKQDRAKAKFVVSPSVLAPFSRETAGDAAYALRADAWDGFPASLERLLGFIAQNEIRNVVFLSGDFHSSLFCTMTLQYQGKAAVPAYSIVSSGLYSPYPFANTLARDLALKFKGRRGAWSIDYEAKEKAACASFALVCASSDPSGRGWLEVEFDAGERVKEPLR